MTTRATRKLDARLERLEAAAQGAGWAMVCPHQSADELHRPLINEYLQSHAWKHMAGFGTGLIVFAALLLILF